MVGKAVQEIGCRMSVSVHSGGEPKNREDITVGHTEVPVKVYRTDGFPTIFAGFRVGWLSGEDPTTGASFELDSGAGCGSPYMTLRVEIPGKPTVYEYVDIREFLKQRVQAIIEENK